MTSGGPPDGADLVVVCDFDGTLTELDLGDALCDRFAPPAWKQIDDRYVAGELALDEAQRLMWAEVRAFEADWELAVTELGALRAGAHDFLNFLVRAAVPTAIASGGFDLYIDQVLARWHGHFFARYANVLRLQAGEARVEFLLRERFGCHRCAVCKGRVLDDIRAQHRPARLVFVGDGHSDLCALGRADEIYAVRQGALHRGGVATGAAVRPFDDLREVLDAIQAPLS